VRDWRPGDPETRGEDRQENMSVPSVGTIDIDVLNGNPELDPATIIAILRRAIDQTLQINGIHEPDVVTFYSEPGRKTPAIRPYLDYPDHTWVQTVSACMQKVIGQPPVIKAGKGTADEGALVHEMNIPTVILPPICQGEHTKDERVRLSSIDQNANVLVQLAQVDHPLTYVQYQ